MDHTLDDHEPKKHNHANVWQLRHKGRDTGDSRNLDMFLILNKKETQSHPFVDELS